MGSFTWDLMFIKEVRMKRKWLVLIGLLMLMDSLGENQNAYTVNERLGRGINLGNMLEAPRDRAWERFDVAYFDIIKKAGFSSVRIPVRWSDYAAEEAPYTIDPDFIRRVDTIIEEAIKCKLIVILNVHHYKEFMVEPSAHAERLLRLWEQLAVRYRNAPRALCFEVLNEPVGNVTQDFWNHVQNDAIDLIRRTNPERIIFVAPLGWNQIHFLRNLELPSRDQNLIASVHFYEPFEFTHQGASWVKNEIPVGTPWMGSDDERGKLLASLDEAARWSKEHNIPINVGEFGAYSKADMASRVRWTGFLCREMEKRGFSWNYWEFCSSFGAYDLDAGAWRPELLAALIPVDE